MEIEQAGVTEIVVTGEMSHTRSMVRRNKYYNSIPYLYVFIY